MLGPEPATSSNQSHAIVNPLDSKLGQSVWRNDIDEAPVRCFENTRFGINANRTFPVLFDHIDRGADAKEIVAFAKKRTTGGGPLSL